MQSREMQGILQQEILWETTVGYVKEAMELPVDTGVQDQT
jgi:hypothetical protein